MMYTVFQGMLIVVECPNEPPVVIDEDGAHEMKPGKNGGFFFVYERE